MAQFTRYTVVSALLALANAQSQSAVVTQVLFPLVDDQPLDASLIGTGPNDVKTLAINCSPGTPSEDCGLPEPVTVTAGPSTFHWSATGSYLMYGNYDCTLTGTTEGVCQLTAGLYDSMIPTGSGWETETAWQTSSAASSSSQTATLSASDLESAFVAVTITAGLDATATGSGSSSTGTGSSASGSGSGSESSGGSATRTSSGAVASQTGNGAASLSALKMSGMGLGLMALPMLLL